MHKNYMLICDERTELNAEWEQGYLFFDTEKEMKEYIISNKNNIKVARMCVLENVKWTD